jgi:hypothetical protein
VNEPEPRIQTAFSGAGPFLFVFERRFTLAQGTTEEFGT